MPRSKEDVLGDIFTDEDPDGLLEIKPTATVRDADRRIIDGFLEINSFYDAREREPNEAASDIQEKMLAYRLVGLRKSTEHSTLLREYDRFGLISSPTDTAPAAPPAMEMPETPVYSHPPSSLDDIFADDDLDLLDDGDELGLRELRHVPKATSMPDYVASRKRCTDFADFVDLFVRCQSDLEAGKRMLVDFSKEQQIDVGNFFVLKGVLAYVAEVGNRAADENGKTNARLRLIFENGTESDMLLRSLAAELYKDGRRVTAHEDRQLDKFVGLAEDDRNTGYLYVLSSRSSEPQITAFPHLYKIGFSRTPVADRIRNAANEPTYLMAEVKVEGVWECYNLNPNRLEGLLHRFFGKACLDVQLRGPNGRYHTPREWFLAPLPIIERAVEMIVSGEIVDYRYDAERMAVVRVGK